MKPPSFPARALILAAALGARSSAQEAWSTAFHMNAGPTQGGLRDVSQNTGYTYGLSLELGYRIGRDSLLVSSFGYQWFPGDNKVLSYIPLSAPATGVNPSFYESRDRKLDSAGFQLGLAYRRDVAPEFYYQVGLRIGSNKASEKDTGSRITTNGKAVPNLGNTSDPNILAVETIASLKESTILSVGPALGVGYRLTENKTLTLDFNMARIPGPSAGTKTGWSTELGIQARF